MKRQSVLTTTVVAVSLLTGSRAFGWGFDEHTELGSKGYKAACAQVARDLKLDVKPEPEPPVIAGGVSPADVQAGGPPLCEPEGLFDPCVKPRDDATARWCLACRAFSPALYGQSVAIAGDHVGSPEELWSPNGQIVATNVVDYTFLALVNVQHFHPAAPRNWRTFHDKALELATKDYPGGPIAREFAQVFYTSAFADHFLQDAFSAGHAGFNRPATGAVASKRFHDIWNESGRVVRSPAGRCWLQYGDGKLKYATVPARFQIDAAEEASVTDVLAAFITGKRDAGREIRPVYYMPAEITRNPLPEPVWGAFRGESAGEVVEEIVGGPKQTAQAQAGDNVQAAPKVFNPAIIDRIYEEQRRELTDGTCVAEMVPIDGMSNPAVINGGFDVWGVGAYDSQTTYGSLDVLYNHRVPSFLSFMSLRASWEAGLGFGRLRREGRDAWAPSATVGVLTPPLYLIHGLWRNEIGGQAKGYRLLGSGPERTNGYGTVFLRSSLEIATWIVRLQAGPTVDFRSGRLGVVAALGLEFPGTRWITGGGSLNDF